ncbi:geranylgeranylglyceryl/heptaprenylglyceryl phosphate synthase [Candidatus Bathyarchaeota archaeon]|nr:MAG: geranylgeranylglyceryl/heptaprenylglyceryl phosphate synthase [Candidatus Bathyarchaeota archaeon]
MPKLGRVERYLLERIEGEGAIHMTLLDPEKVTPEQAAKIASEAEEAGTSAIMVGGSTLATTEELDGVILAMRENGLSVPVILFPNNVTGISRHADAIWFMSLLNSVDPYFLIGAQVLGAPVVRRFGLEAIPMGYIIVGYGGAAGIIGRATPIPYEKPELAAAYAMAAECLGMRFVYLEAGSGAPKPVPEAMIMAVRKAVRIPLIVGGGLRDGEGVERAVRAGANVVVTGTAVESGGNVGEKIRSFVSAIRRGVEKRPPGLGAL